MVGFAGSELPAATTEADLFLLPSLLSSRSHFPPFHSVISHSTSPYFRYPPQASTSALAPSRSRKPPPESLPLTSETARLQHWTPRRRPSRERCRTRSPRRPRQSRSRGREDMAPSARARATFVAEVHGWGVCLRACWESILYVSAVSFIVCCVHSKQLINFSQ